MLRLASRFFGYWVMAAALVAAVVDGAKSLAASRLVWTSLSEALALIAGAGVQGAGSAEPLGAAAAYPWPLDVLSRWLLSAPLVAILAVLGAVFLTAGRKRRSFAISREFAT